MNNFEIYITMQNQSPDFEDFSRARSELWNLGITDESKIGIMLTKSQWINFKANISRFEFNMVSVKGMNNDTNRIMGFPVKIVEFEVIQK